MSLQKTFLHQAQNAPIKRGTLELITPVSHELEQLVVRDEFRMDNLPQQRDVLDRVEFDGALRESHRVVIREDAAWHATPGPGPDLR